MSDLPYQSLYRRYRPQKFAELRGQDHVVLALRNAVRDERVAHAYLFSGPRGTGKTSTARILAKALNCTDLQDGEPCGVCDSCVQVQLGSSLDVHELDAASNNGVDAMRDLVSRAALGTPGRWKVYIIDEVHMLSTAASNALLKTLEEPPGHVVFVLATTDPQKILPTIRSRTQHFEFHLLPADTLGDLLRDINSDADLGVAEEAIDFVIRRGNGSARDALSVLDQVAAAGSVSDDGEVIDDIVAAICDRDAARALVGIATAMKHGRDARRIANDLVEHLRNGFLATMARSLVMLSDDAVARVEEQARQFGTPALVRAMEILGEAMVDMREAVDPRITLEVAVVRIARPDADASPEAMLERLDRLERGVSSHLTEGDRQVAHAVTASAEPKAEPAPAQPGRPAASDARAALGAVRKVAAPAAATAPKSAPPAALKAQAEAATPAPATETQESNTTFDRDELTKAWGDVVLDELPQRAKARFRVGRFVSVDGTTAQFALPNQIHRDRCLEVQPEVEAALSAFFHTSVHLQLVVDDGSAAETTVSENAGEEDINLDDLRVADDVAATPEDRVKLAFPGAEEVS